MIEVEKKRIALYALIILCGLGIGMKLPDLYHYAIYKLYYKIPDQVSIGDNTKYYKKHNSIVLVYGTQTCEACQKTRAFFEKEKVDFKFLDIEQDFAAHEDMQDFGMNGVPVILINNQRILGYSGKVLKASILTFSESRNDSPDVKIGAK